MKIQVQQNLGRRIAYFVSPHGLGHAARAAAVMSAMQEIDPLIRFEIFTKVPLWFFQNSLSGAFGYHSLLTDIGLFQKTPLHEDMNETAALLDDFLPFDGYRIADISRTVRELKCELIICDIAPMGIAAARQAGIPSVLIENFTWDWIYEGYPSDGQLKKHIKYLRNIFDAADYHIQTDPVCCRAAAQLTTLPVSRKPRTPAGNIREKLGISENQKAVIITMGGIPAFRYPAREWERLHAGKDICFIVPGAPLFEICENLILLPHDSEFFHPDLINACDAVIGKVGYSTLAEVFHAGVPFGYILRPLFRESEVLGDFIERGMSGIPIEETAFHSGAWLSCLESLFSLPRIQRHDPNGSEQAADFIYKLLGN